MRKRVDEQRAIVAPIKDRLAAPVSRPLEGVAHRVPLRKSVVARDRFRALGALLRAINVAVYAACFRRLAIFAMVARLQPVNDWIVLQDWCAASI